MNLDLISREALVKDLEESIVFSGRPDASIFMATMRGADLVKDRIMEAPAVDAVEVVHAKWDERPVNVGTPTTDLFCSRCSFPSHHWKYNYCPNCGARMDGE